ncbi:LOW QUALITY PROTEIN: tripartite motif-containing protein 14-like [Gastrophryne carolinensis]
MLKCEHNFCLVCIDRVLETQERSGGYSCPECREQFQKRPTLKRNIKLRNVVENFLATRPNQEEVGIFCTYCVDSPVAAVKSCLHCEASLCEKHLTFHMKSPEHVLTDPSSSLGNRKCPVHKKVLEYYCTQDATCICVSCCLAGEHRGHHVQTFLEASENKKRKLKNVLKQMPTMREKIELKELEEKALSKISNNVKQFTFSMSNLEEKKDELSRKMRHIEELCNTTDPLTLLQEPDTGDLCDTEEGGNEDRKRRKKELHDEGPDLDVTGISHSLDHLSDIIREVNLGFYFHDDAGITLDVDTAHYSLEISADGGTVPCSYGKRYSEMTSKRFQSYQQVLSHQSFSSGRHYWEVDGWSVGMCYPSIDRMGCNASLGNNNVSWCLYYNQTGYGLMHNYQVTHLPIPRSSKKVRIYPDYEARKICFYDLCNRKKLHTFTATFTEPLHAAIAVNTGCITISGGGGKIVNVRAASYT